MKTTAAVDIRRTSFCLGCLTIGLSCCGITPPPSMARCSKPMSASGDASSLTPFSCSHYRKHLGNLSISAFHRFHPWSCCILFSLSSIPVPCHSLPFSRILLSYYLQWASWSKRGAGQKGRLNLMAPSLRQQSLLPRSHSPRSLLPKSRSPRSLLPKNHSPRRTPRPKQRSNLLLL